MRMCNCRRIQIQTRYLLFFFLCFCLYCLHFSLCSAWVRCWLMLPQRFSRLVMHFRCATLPFNCVCSLLFFVVVVVYTGLLLNLLSSSTSELTSTVVGFFVAAASAVGRISVLLLFLFSSLQSSEAIAANATALHSIHFIYI